ncbi:MAG: hypothetical protein HRS50_00855 [Mycoplasmataceae bacterium]|nr:hypothetical protein [Mycoplasmataceae bacterium]
MKTQRIIGKHALILIAKGEKEIASQIFVYNHIREIRVDIENLEVKVLMSYDSSYFRVLKITSTKILSKEKALNIVIDFYNNLLNASIKLTPEEIENIKSQRESQKKNLNKNE